MSTLNVKETSTLIKQLKKNLLDPERTQNAQRAAVSEKIQAQAALAEGTTEAAVQAKISLTLDKWTDEAQKALAEHKQQQAENPSPTPGATG